MISQMVFYVVGEKKIFLFSLFKNQKYDFASFQRRRVRASKESVLRHTETEYEMNN